MVFEHFALNVANLAAVVRWYADNMGLKIISAQAEPPYMTFLADSSNRVVLELYHREDAVITNFEQAHPLTFHVAFVSGNVTQDKDRLTGLGATLVEEVKKEDGSHLIMMRDPWGMPLQLCQRTTGL